MKLLGYAALLAVLCYGCAKHEVTPPPAPAPSDTFTMLLQSPAELKTAVETMGKRGYTNCHLHILELSQANDGPATLTCMKPMPYINPKVLHKDTP
jgi:hypothetical protein